MTASLIEAFHVAAIRFVRWQHNNNEIDEGFVIWQGVGPKEFLPEPTVAFFGQEHKISVICERAKVLQGRMPLPLTMLFCSLVDPHNHGETEYLTFPDAVETLEGWITNELERERSDLPLRDRILQHAKNELIDAFEAKLKEASS